MSPGRPGAASRDEHAANPPESPFWGSLGKPWPIQGAALARGSREVAACGLDLTALVGFPRVLEHHHDSPWSER